MVSDNYLELVDKFIFKGIPLKHIAMTEPQKLRTMIVYEAYQVWLNNKQIKPMDVCRRISRRTYDDMLEKAKHNPEYAERCQRLKIYPGKDRPYNEIANDIATFDHIVGLLNTGTINIEKAKVVDASDWLIAEGMKNGNERSVTSGAKLKMDLYKGFDERQQGFENLADTDITITSDVSVVKPGRENYTDEEKEQFKKKWGLTSNEVEELIQNDRGEYETAPVDEEREHDIFVKKEEEHG